jgi:hypothetical protein
VEKPQFPSIVNNRRFPRSARDDNKIGLSTQLLNEASPFYLEYASAAARQSCAVNTVPGLDLSPQSAVSSIEISADGRALYPHYRRSA